jgi:sporulation protein YlmC with PRC-barrel domain
MGVVKDTEITGKKVILEDASAIGHVSDVFIETSDWRITKLRIRLEKRYAERLGVESGILKKPMIPVLIHTVKSVGDVVHLKGSLDDLKRSQKTVTPEMRPEPPKVTQPAAKPAEKPKAPPKPRTPPTSEKPRKL